MTFLAAILAAVWISGTEGPSALTDAANLTGRVVASRFDGTNDYTTVYFTHDMDRAPSAAVCYVAKDATNAVYGIWQGGWTNKVAIGGIQGDVYEGVEYLRCSKCGINTGIYPNIKTTVQASFSSSDTSDWQLFGVRGYGFDIRTFRSVYAYGENSNKDFTPAFGNFMNGEIVTFQLGKSLSFVSVDGTMRNSWTPTTTSANTATKPLYLMATMYNNGISDRPFVGNYYSAIIWQDGEYTRYFLPVLHNGEGKMLDLVNGTLYSNAGTGTFTVGPSKGEIIVPTGGWGQNVPEDPYQTAKWSDCRILVTRRPAALRNAEARPDLRFAFGNAETHTPFAVKGLDLTINSNAVTVVDGILTKKGN